MKVYEEEGKLYVISEYSNKFVKKARLLNGKWNGKAWTFDISDKDFVLDALLEIYGENGTADVEKVSVIVNLEKYTDAKYKYFYNCIEIFNRSVLTRNYRDNPVRIADYCIVTKGSFSSCGGSRNNPQIGSVEGIELKLKNIPRVIVEREIEKYGSDSITIIEEDKKESNPKQIKTLIRYRKNTNEIISTYPICEGERIIIENNQIIVSKTEEIENYLYNKIEDYDLKKAPFGIDDNEYFEIIDGIVEQ